MLKKKQNGPPTSKYLGVSKHPRGGWVAQRKVNGENTYLGIFKEEVSAAIAYDTYTSKLIEDQTISKHQHINFPNRVPEELNDNYTEGSLTSKFHGVTWYETRKIWKASVQINKKKTYLGRFYTREDAARAYNAKLISEANNISDLKLKNKLLRKTYTVPETSTFFPNETYVKRLKHTDKEASNVADHYTSAGAANTANNAADDLFLDFMQYSSYQNSGSIFDFMVDPEPPIQAVMIDQDDSGSELRSYTPSPPLLFAFESYVQGLDLNNLTFDGLSFIDDDTLSEFEPFTSSSQSSTKSQYS